MSLFPGAAEGSSRPPLFQLRAGKCEVVPLPNGKFRVSPDLRRGNIVVSKDDEFVRFKWVNLVTGQAEDERIIMPGEYTFKKVKTGNDSDRVYWVKMNGGPKLLYWLQAKATDKDEENEKKLNDIFARPSEMLAGDAAASGISNWLGARPSGPFGAAASSSQPPNFGQLDISSIMASLNRPVTAPGGQPAVAPPAAAPTGAGSTLTVDNLRRALEMIRPNAPAAAPATQSQAAAPLRTASLENVLQADEILRTGVLDDPEGDPIIFILGFLVVSRYFCLVRRELISHLPAEQQDEENLRATLRSAQLRQSESTLSNALSSDPAHFHAITSNLQLQTNSPQVQQQLMRGDNVGAFLSAVQGTFPSTDNGNNASEGDESTTGANQPMEE